MAKDDYDVIAYRILVYLYACFKHQIIYDEDAFREAVRKNVANDQHFYGILFLMQEENLIRGLLFKKAWGGDRLLLSDLREAEITADGIHYLKDNSTMKKIGDMMKEAGDMIATLASMILFK